MCRCMGAISVTPFCRTHLQRYKKNATFASFITIKFPQTDFFSQHPSKHPKLLTLFALFLEINCCFAFLYYYVLHSSEKCRIFASRSANGAHRCLTAFSFRRLAFDFRLSTIDFQRLAFDFRLSTLSFRLSTID